MRTEFLQTNWSFESGVPFGGTDSARAAADLIASASFTASSCPAATAASAWSDHVHPSALPVTAVIAASMALRSGPLNGTKPFAATNALAHSGRFGLLPSARFAESLVR
jgi:hypothetical protein